MLGRIVEIADDKKHLSVFRGFLVVKNFADCQQNETHKVPLDDIIAVVGNAYGLSYTNNLLVALAERGIPFIICGTNHNVTGILLSVDGHYQQAKRFDAQIAANLPANKKLWMQIIKSKLSWQAAVLEKIDSSPNQLQNLISKVRSGDPTNVEAQGARRYWSLLFGSAFRRDKNAGGINALLNYGYTVLRATVARAITCAGLHPTIGIHHKNENNALRLIDDVMEPFRPIIDFKVWQLYQNNKIEVNAETKKEIALTMFVDIKTNAGISPLTTCIQKCAISLAQFYLGETNCLELPVKFPTYDELYLAI